MGADGGVVYVRVRAPVEENCARARALLKPFWQLFDVRGQDWADDTRDEWRRDNPDKREPHYLVGSYGTDMGDYVCLDDLPVVFRAEKWEEGAELYELTFDELDLDYRTTPLPVAGPVGSLVGDAHPLHALWYQHFMYTGRDEVLEKLGELASMRVREWVQRLREAADWGNLGTVETWT